MSPHHTTLKTPDQLSTQTLTPRVCGCVCSVFAVVLNVLTAQSLGLLLGAAVMNTKTAQTIASVMMLAFMLVGGYYVRVSPFPFGRGGVL